MKFIKGQLVKFEWGGQYCYGRVYFAGDTDSPTTVGIECTNGRCVGGPLDLLAKQGYEIQACHSAEPNFEALTQWASGAEYTN